MTEQTQPQPDIEVKSCPCCGEALSRGGHFWMHHFNECALEGFKVAVDDADRINSWNARAQPSPREVALTAAEKQSGFDRLRFAEGLIKQLPENHDGRNTWLLNYGRGEEAVALRDRRGIGWDEHTQAASLAMGGKEGK